MSVYKNTANEEVTTFKILLIGSSGVGKSSLLVKYVRNTFSYDYNVTTGVQFFTKTVKINQKTNIKLQIWDTVGQQAFKSVVRSFYKGVAAIILMYSIDKLQSFQQLSSWMHEIKENSNPQSCIYLVATKVDLQDIRKVSKNNGQEYSKSVNAAGFMEVSSKTGQNIKQLFQKISKGLYKKFQTNSSFRNLVKPMMAENGMEKSTSFNLGSYNNTKPIRNKREGECC